MTVQVIFQVHLNGKWLDYCREESPRPQGNLTSNWAIDQCDMLEKREGKPFRFIVEVWN
jgi:hypothetical protein